MGNLLKKKLRGIMTGAVMSIGKVQESLSQNFNGVEDNISIQKEVEKREIKLLKKEKFYNLLDESNKYQKSIRNMSLENKQRFIELSQLSPETNEEKVAIANEIHELMMVGINQNNNKYQEPTSFKNRRLGDLMENINNLDPNAKHVFETNNDLYKLTHYVKLIKTDNENEIHLDFYVNPHINPSIRFVDVTNLTYFKVVDEGRTYLYNVTKYQGCITQTNFDITYRFTSTIEKNGVYDFEMEREDAVLDKHNTMSHKNAKFNLGYS